MSFLRKNPEEQFEQTDWSTQESQLEEQESQVLAEVFWKKVSGHVGWQRSSVLRKRVELH